MTQRKPAAQEVVSSQKVGFAAVQPATTAESDTAAVTQAEISLALVAGRVTSGVMQLSPCVFCRRAAEEPSRASGIIGLLAAELRPTRPFPLAQLPETERHLEILLPPLPGTERHLEGLLPPLPGTERHLEGLPPYAPGMDRYPE
jgi:hypothetical protein